MPNLGTLPGDVYALFNPDEDHICNEQYLDEFAENLKGLFRQRLAKYTPPESPIRFSALGKPNRQLWYDAHPIAGTKEGLTPKTFLKFAYGDVIEQMLLYLVKEAGHVVEMEQGAVEIGGVTGHIDAVIDGVVVDVKSASPYGYKKFERDGVVADDPFGYVAQLSGYANVLTPGEDAAWLAMDKVGGDICVAPLRHNVIKHHQPAERIEELKAVVAMPEPPERCYDDVEDGKSGNRKLSTPCSYCSHKFRCWPGVRGFLYSSGPRFLTVVAKTPDVPEVEGVIIDETVE